MPAPKLVEQPIEGHTGEGRQKRMHPAGTLLELAPIMPNHNPAHPGARDGIDIPADRTAMLLESRPLGAIGFRSRSMAVPLIGVLGDDPE